MSNDPFAGLSSAFNAPGQPYATITANGANSAVGAAAPVSVSIPIPPPAAPAETPIDIDEAAAQEAAQAESAQAAPGDETEAEAAQAETAQEAPDEEEPRQVAGAQAPAAPASDPGFAAGGYAKYGKYVIRITAMNGATFCADAISITPDHRLAVGGRFTDCPTMALEPIKTAASLIQLRIGEALAKVDELEAQKSSAQAEADQYIAAYDAYKTAKQSMKTLMPALDAAIAW